MVADGRAGGGTSHVLHLCRSITSPELDVHLLTDAGSYAEQEAREADLPVHALPFFARGRLHPRLWRDVHRLVKSLDPSLVHAHGARAALPLAMNGFGRRADRKPAFVYSVHGYHFVAKGMIQRRMAALAERRCSKAADRTVFVCNYDKGLAERWKLSAGPRTTDVIYNGIDPMGLPEHRPAERFTIAFLGRLVAQKNPLALIDIMDQVRDLPLDLRIIGDGELRGELERRAKMMGLAERIEITGQLSQVDALKSLAECSTLVLPSHWEGLPLAVLEAMAMGVVVIASRVGGLGEMIDHGKSGWLIEPGRVDGFAARIRELFVNQTVTADMASHAKDRVTHRFAWSRTQEAHLALYRQLIGGR